MTSFFAQLNDSEKALLLPKVQVAASLYRHHNTSLGSLVLRNQIASIDADVGSLLAAVYDQKIFTRQDLIRWMKHQEQVQDTVTVQVTDPERIDTSSLQNETTVTGRDDVGLFALGQGKIYKRTLAQDVDKLLR